MDAPRTSRRTPCAWTRHNSPSGGCGTWKISHAVQPSHHDSVFGFFVYPVDECRVFYDSVSTNTPSTDGTIELDGGTYYLKVISGTAWSVTVTDLPG